jgi:hypothetical protein
VSVQKQFALLQTISRLDEERPEGCFPLIALDEFLAAEWDCDEVISNGPVPIATFASVTRDLAQQPEIDSLWLSIVDYDRDFEDHPDDLWAGADTLFAVGTMSLQDFQAWVAPLRPNETHIETADGYPRVYPPLAAPPGKHILVAWWD